MATTQPSYEYDPKGMEFKRLGRAGLRVPRLSLGFWLTVGGSVKGDLSKEIIKTAFENGINMFDTAEGYGEGESERELGRVIRELGYRRTDLIISTKIFFGIGRKGPNDKGLSRKHLIEGLHESLERLQMDYVDIVFAHRPDEGVPMAEIVRTFNFLIDTGKAFYWGTSEWSAVQIEEAHHVAKELHLIPPVADQCCYHGYRRNKMEKEFQHVFSRYGYGTTTFSALDCGYLTGKYNNFTIPPDSRLATSAKDDFIGTVVKQLQSPVGKAKVAIAQKLEVIAKEEVGCTTAQLAIAWVARNPNTSTVILGASNPQQVLDNLKALEVIPKITDSLYEKLNALFDEYEYKE
ncbi:hypothetical protein FRC01_007821 [Tulasnella sp. 417]|nr:hypothetical protein FRC01_007821 [Tulasnella sp. 417]